MKAIHMYIQDYTICTITPHIRRKMQLNSLYRNISFLFIDRKGDYVVHLPLEEQIVWIWALIFSFATPEVFTFFRSLRFCIFKDVKSPTWLEVLLVTKHSQLYVEV